MAALGLAGASLVEAGSAVNYDEVRRAIAEMIDENPDYDDGSYGPLFVRLAWHAAGSYSKVDNSGGSDGARMRFSPEAFWGGNAGLPLARNQMQRLKKRFPGISYADLWTLAGAVAIEHMGGPKIAWRSGRTDDADGARSPQSDNRLPDASQGAEHLRAVFYRMGFTDREIVALSGAHCLGRCHTTRSGFSGPWTYAPTTFSNDYFKLLLSEKWTKKAWDGPEQFENPGGALMMLPSDMALVHDPNFRAVVEEYARDEAAFRADFAAAFAKLLELGVDPSKLSAPSAGSPASGSPVPVQTIAIVGGGLAAVLGGAYVGYRMLPTRADK